MGRGWAGAAAFIFSLPHVIFIVNKTHLAFLSERGLAGEASILAEKKAAGWEGRRAVGKKPRKRGGIRLGEECEENSRRKIFWGKGGAGG